MKQIKTVMHPINAVAEFDAEVNALLADGWRLVQRSIVGSSVFVASMEKADKPEPKPEGFVRDAHKGFLYIRCEHCGKEKGFNAKRPTSGHYCECGHLNRLENLAEVNAVCVNAEKNGTTRLTSLTETFP